MPQLLCLVLAAWIVPAAPVLGAHFKEVREVAAQDGVGAAVEWSKLAFPDTAASALIGRADLFADSLASGGLQGTQPLLLTSSSQLSAATAAELERLKVETVTILGGTGAVSAAVADELRDKGYEVKRLSGATRIETAVAVARAGTGNRTALLARAFGGSDPTAAFADALSAGAWAAETGSPVLLTETERLTGPTANYLGSEADFVRVVGGRAAVSDATVAQVEALGLTVERVSGPSRFDTAIEIAKRRGAASAADAQEVILIDGQGANSWIDGFAAAAYAGRNKAPIVLANSASGTLPDVTRTFLQAGPAARLLTGWTVPSAQVDEAAQIMGKTAGVTRVMQVRLSGRNVVRTLDSDANDPLWGYGEDGATGLLTMTVDEEKRTIAYTYEGESDSRPADSNALVLRRGGLDERGPVVVRFPEPSRENAGSGTVDAEAFDDPEFDINELLSTPEAFYAEAATDRDEDGAMRGQLPSGGEAHLPVKPEFVRIESKGADDFVTLHFAAPVYAPEGLEPDDFEVMVGDGLIASVEATNGFQVATTPETARASLVLNLNRDAVKGKTTSVKLTSSAAGDLLSNLGEHPSSATKTEVTPEDVTDPVFEAIEAVGQGNILTVVFSEPVYTTAADLKPLTSITSTAGGTTTTYKIVDGTIDARDKRATRWELVLDQFIPASSEVRLTFTGPATTAGTAAANIVDGSGRKLSSAVLTRTVSTRGGATSFDGLRVSNLVVGGGRFDPARNQDQTIVGTIVGDLPGTADLVLPNVELGHESGNPYNAVSYKRAWGLLTWSGLSTPVVDNDISGGRFDLPDGVVVPDGKTFTLTLKDVAVTRTTATSAPLEFRLRRTDTNGVAVGEFSVLDGVEVLSSAVLPAGKDAPSHEIKIKPRPGLPNSKSIFIDVSALASQGVVYGTANPTVTAVTPADSVAATWDGPAGSRVKLTANASGPATSITVTLPVAQALPSNERYNVPVVFERPDEAGMARVTQYHSILTKTAATTPTVSSPRWGPSPAATPNSMTVTFPLHSTLPKGQEVTFDFAHAMFALPSTSSGAWASSMSGKKITFKDAVNDTPSGNLSFSVDVDTSLSGREFPVHVWRSDQLAMRWTVVVPVTPVTGLGDVPLSWVSSSGSSAYGQATNDKLTLFFHGKISSVTDGRIALRLTAGGGTDEKIIPCNSTYVCEIDSTELRQVTITYKGANPSTSPGPAANTNGRAVSAVSGFQAMGSGVVGTFWQAGTGTPPGTPTAAVTVNAPIPSSVAPVPPP